MDYAAGVLSVWSPHPSYDSVLPPLHTVQYMFTCIQYTNQREGKRGNTVVYKVGRKYQHDWLYLKSINSINQQ